MELILLTLLYVTNYKVTGWRFQAQLLYFPGVKWRFNINISYFSLADWTGHYPVTLEQFSCLLFGHQSITYNCSGTRSTDTPWPFTSFVINSRNIPAYRRSHRKHVFIYRLTAKVTSDKVAREQVITRGSWPRIGSLQRSPKSPSCVWGFYF